MFCIDQLYFLRPCLKMTFNDFISFSFQWIPRNRKTHLIFLDGSINMPSTTNLHMVIVTTMRKIMLLALREKRIIDLGLLLLADTAKWDRRHHVVQRVGSKLLSIRPHLSYLVRPPVKAGQTRLCMIH